jgi:hypothetical protein
MIVESEEDRLAKEDGITGNIRAHEDDYFRKRDLELIENLRIADAAAREQRVLEQETGLHDPEMLRELAVLGFTPDTISLLPLIPVLQVAWAKSGISSAERALIVGLARSRGIAAGSPADHQLALWLDVRPTDDTFHKATRLIHAMLEAPEHRVEVSAHDLIEYCDKIAHASGGILGIGVVSPEERAALAEISSALKAR